MAAATKITKEEMIEAIKNMTMVEINDLVTALEEEFGVSAAMPVMAAGAAVAGGGDAGADEKTEFDVVLKNAGSSKIAVIKEIRAITGLGLKEAKAIADGGGKVLEAVGKDKAEEVQKKLADAGAEVVVD